MLLSLFLLQNRILLPDRGQLRPFEAVQLVFIVPIMPIVTYLDNSTAYNKN